MEGSSTTSVCRRSLPSECGVECLRCRGKCAPDRGGEMQSLEVVQFGDGADDVDCGVTVNTKRLDQMGRKGFNVQCINSSDFIVGKRTNFNGPVTIISCTADNLPIDSNRNLSPESELRAVDYGDKTLPEEVTIATEEVKDPIKAEEVQTQKLQSRSRELCCRPFFRVPTYAWILLLCLFLGVAVTLGAESLFHGGGTSIEAETIVTPVGNLTFYDRRDWGARAPRSIVAIKLPIPYVIVGSTGGPRCSGAVDCPSLIRELQSSESKASYVDIYYNFFISDDGSVFEGRGWTNRSEFTGFVNNLNIAVALLGEFDVYQKPTEEQMNSLRVFIAWGLDAERIQPNYRLIPANATGLGFHLYKKPVIGSNLYSVIRDLPHFDSDPYSKILVSN